MDFAAIHFLGPNCRNSRALFPTPYWHAFKRTKCYAKYNYVPAANSTPSAPRRPHRPRTPRVTASSNRRTSSIVPPRRRWTPRSYSEHETRARAPLPPPRPPLQTPHVADDDESADDEQNSLSPPQYPLENDNRRVDAPSAPLPPYPVPYPQPPSVGQRPLAPPHPLYPVEPQQEQETQIHEQEKGRRMIIARASRSAHANLISSRACFSIIARETKHRHHRRCRVRLKMQMEMS